MLPDVSRVSLDSEYYLLLKAHWPVIMQASQGEAGQLPILAGEIAVLVSEGDITFHPAEDHDVLLLSIPVESPNYEEVQATVRSLGVLVTTA